MGHASGWIHRRCCDRTPICARALTTKVGTAYFHPQWLSLSSAEDNKYRMLTAPLHPLQHRHLIVGLHFLLHDIAAKSFRGHEEEQSR